MKCSEPFLDIMLVRSEDRSQMRGCTHICRHLHAMLHVCEQVLAYPVRFNVSQGQPMQAALCRECFLRVPRQNQNLQNE